MRIYRRERRVTLVTGPGYTKDDIEFLTQSVKTSYLRPEDSMVFNHQVDESILGGLKVVVDGVESDYSWDNRAVENVKTEAYTDAYGPVDKQSDYDRVEEFFQKNGISKDIYNTATDANMSKAVIDMKNRRKKRSMAYVDRMMKKPQKSESH